MLSTHIFGSKQSIKSIVHFDSRQSSYCDVSTKEGQSMQSLNSALMTLMIILDDLSVVDNINLSQVPVNEHFNRH
eukprot:89140-Amphidinium_carterae.2